MQLKAGKYRSLQVTLTNRVRGSDIKDSVVELPPPPKWVEVNKGWRGIDLLKVRSETAEIQGKAGRLGLVL